MTKSIEVVRIGHRYVRDYRTLTHLCLVSRAMGAETVYLEEMEEGLAEKVEEVNRTWGGEFRVERVPSWRGVFHRARSEGRVIIHLTMYGLPLQDEISGLRKEEKFLVAVGGPKVPGEVYETAHFNIAVTAQPHSEIAALAVVMHELQSGEELKKEFRSARLKIVPSARGKQVEKIS